MPKNDTRFVKGKSGNPSGRPKTIGAMQDLARQHTAAAFTALVEALKDKSSRVAAATVLLDRGWGKATTILESGPGGLTINVNTGVERAPSGD
jgi:hypothetical protein